MPTDSTATYIPIRNPKTLRLVRLGWGLLAMLNILLLVGSFFADIDLSRGQYERIIPYIQNPDAYRDLFHTLYHIPFLMIAILAYTIGFAIFLRRSNNRAAIFLSMMLIAGVPNFSPVALEMQRISLFWKGLVAITWPLALGNIYMFLFTFPDGRFYPRYTRYLLGIFMVWEFYRIFLYTTQDTTPNTIFLITIGLWGVSLLMQIHRYRNYSSQIEKQQTKWIVLGAAFNVVIYFFGILGVEQAPHFFSDKTLVYVVSFCNDAPFVGMAIFMLSIAAAITRRGLWEIDLTINRSLVYGGVTLFLGGVFVGIAWGFQQVIGASNAAIAYAISAVTAGVLFNPSRQRIQHVIDRRFYNLRFDLNELQHGQQKPVIKNPGALTGQRVGDYHLLGVIGRGGMGEVYRAQHKSGMIVAIKVLSDALALGDEFRQRFEQEARILTSLKHPHIVTMHGAGKSRDIHYLAMEFINGIELKERLSEAGVLSLEDVCDVMQGLTAALAYAHEQGLVHRDIKPSNVMLCLNDDDETYRSILMDFGVAKMQDAQANLTGTSAVGTIDYMAPEQIEISHEVDRRADIYALGVTLYEMLTGERPFKGSPAQVLFAHLQQPPPDPRQVNDTIPDEVARAVVKAMAKKPDARFQSTGELMTVLQKVNLAKKLL